MIDQVHLAHLRRASLVQGKPLEPRQCQGRLVRLGRRRSRTARRPTTGCRSSAARPGSGTRAASSITCTISWPSSRTSISTTARCRTRCSTSIRFWLERGVDGFRLDTINFYFHSARARGQSGAAAKASATTRSRRRSTPTISRTISTTRAGRRTSLSCERFRALLDEYPATAAVGEVGDAQRGLEVVAAYTAGGDRVQMCYSFDFLGPEKLSARQGARGARNLRQGRQRRLVVLGACPTMTWCATPRAGATASRTEPPISR